ncbi:HrcA family transcriptional regulator [uncultured Helicobacter sp.]|uniref:HrcA family transcriptional regulator n=1 Tax=uncultured Helicobacter sp. TaxID=175537 RepID=UPI001C3C082F|nr:HrcA family transcriptional regulator [Candidatus Helicobacter avicola]
MSSKKDVLLEQVIMQYLKSKEPIGSESLKASCHMGVSSATIRNYFKTLVQEGWLAQPHISSGRIPTYAALKNHWIKYIDPKSPCIAQNLESVRQSSYKHNICCIVRFHARNVLKDIINIQNDFLALKLERGYAILSYNASLERFLHELKNLDIADIQKIAYQVRAKELLEALSNAQEGEMAHFCISAIYEMLALTSNEEVFLDIINGYIFHKLQNGIYFEELLPKNYLGIVQEFRTAQGQSGHILVCGKIDRDYVSFYNQLAS